MYRMPMLVSNDIDIYKLRNPASSLLYNFLKPLYLSSPDHDRASSGGYYLGCTVWQVILSRWSSYVRSGTASPTYMVRFDLFPVTAR